MRMWHRIVGAGALLAGLALGAGTVEAGEPGPQPIGGLEIDVRVVGPEAANADSWAPEVYVGGTDVRLLLCGSSFVDEYDGDLEAGRLYDCPVTETTTITLGFPTPPEPYTVEFECGNNIIINEQFADESATFTIDGDFTTFLTCQIIMATNMVFIDKAFPYQEVFEGDQPDPIPDPVGGAEHGDFTLELYDDGGSLYDSGVDDDGLLCSGFDAVANGNCIVIEVPVGDYVVGETGLPGYLPGTVDCGFVGSPFEGGRPPIIEPPLGQLGQLDQFDWSSREQFPANEGTAFSIFGEIPGESVYCFIVNEYYEGSVTLTKEITNDDGGTAVMGDFTLELYDGDGNLVDSGVCANDGVCLEGDYPVDDYVVGEVGPDGYTRTVTQEILVPSEQLTDEDASFTLEPFAQVTVNVASDDDPLPPTTTTTTTTSVPTTLGPTTTDVGAGVVTLPATGSDDQTGILAAVAAVLLVLGGAATVLARRRTA